MKDVAIQVRMPKELRDQLNKVCDKKKLKRSELIRDKIEEIIKENK
jgi:metal-responsive CopG/Arc/MetJ family transcriptional regulator